MPGRGRGRPNITYDPWQPVSRPPSAPSLRASLPPPLRDEYARQFNPAPKPRSDSPSQKYAHLEATIDEWARYTFRCRKAVLKADAALVSAGASPGSALKLADDWEGKFKAAESELAGVKATLEVQKKIAADSKAQLEVERARNAEVVEKLQEELAQRPVVATRAPRVVEFEEEIAVVLPPRTKPAASPATQPRPAGCNGHPGDVATAAQRTIAHPSSSSTQFSAPIPGRIDRASTQQPVRPLHRPGRRPLLSFGTIDAFDPAPHTFTQNKGDPRPSNVGGGRAAQTPPRLDQFTATPPAPAVAVTPATPGSYPSRPAAPAGPMGDSKATMPMAPSNGRVPRAPATQAQSVQQQMPVPNSTTPTYSSTVSNSPPPVQSLQPQSSPVNNASAPSEANNTDIKVSIPRSPAGPSSHHSAASRSRQTRSKSEGISQSQRPENEPAQNSSQSPRNASQAANKSTTHDKAQGNASPTQESRNNKQQTNSSTPQKIPSTPPSQSEKPTVYRDAPSPTHPFPVRPSFAAALASKNVNTPPTPFNKKNLVSPTVGATLVTTTPPSKPKRPVHTKASQPAADTTKEPKTNNLKDTTQNPNNVKSKGAKKREKDKARKAKKRVEAENLDDGWSWA